jgi:heme O synthase-like polyprenyltransferase
MIYGSIAGARRRVLCVPGWFACCARSAGEGVPAEDKRARDLFGFSILYLFAIFAAILAERGLRMS